MQIEFPEAGVDRGASFPRQRPYSTPDCLNVLPIGSMTGRARGGSRPGLVRMYNDSDAVGSNWASIRMAATLHPAMGTSVGAWQEDFATYVVGGAIGAPWQLAYSDPLLPAALPIVKEDSQQRRLATLEATTYVDKYGAASVPAETLLANCDFAKEYRLTASFRPMDWLFFDQQYDYFFWSFSFFFRATAVNSNWKTSAIEVRVTQAFYDSISVEVFDSGVRKDGKSLYGPTAGPIEIVARVSGNNAQVFANGLAVTAQFAATSQGGHAAGFWTELRRSREEDPDNPGEYFGGKAPTLGIGLDALRSDYYLTAATRTLEDSRPILAFSRGTVEWYDPAGTKWSAEGVDDCNLNSLAKSLEAVEMNGTLLIADNQPTIVSGTGAKYGGQDGTGTGQYLTGIDFAGKGLTAFNRFCVVMWSPSNAMPPGTYKVLETGGVGAAQWIKIDCPVQSALISDITYRVERAPKIFDPASGAGGTGIAGQLTMWLQSNNSENRPKGAIPAGCPLIARFQNRILMAGRPSHVFYASREGDPFDWDVGFDSDDPGRAFGGTTGEAGRVGNPITAIGHYGDDYFIIGTATELFLGRADMASGAPLLKISDKSGIISKRAWCTLPNGGMMYLSSVGLFELPPGASGRPTERAKAKLPRELLNIDLRRCEPMLAWDSERDLLVILMGDYPPSTSKTHWFYDYRREAFFPFQLAFNVNAEPLCVATYQPNNEKTPKLVIGGYDGIFRYFSDAAGTDYYRQAGPQFSYPSMTSRVLFGPFRDREDLDAIWQSLTGIMGSNSPDVTWAIYAGNCAEQAYANDAGNKSVASGTWKAGRNHIAIPRVRGTAFYLKLSCVSRMPWEMEEIIAEIKPQGVHRPL